MSKGFISDYWKKIVRKSWGRNDKDSQRAHMKEVYQRLIDPWMKNSKAGLALKTDLYDEGVSTHNLIPLSGQRFQRMVGTDVSLEVAMVVKRRMIPDWNG